MHAAGLARNSSVAGTAQGAGEIAARSAQADEASVAGEPRPRMKHDPEPWVSVEEGPGNKQTYADNVPWHEDMATPKTFQARDNETYPELCSYAHHPAVGQDAVYFYNFSTWSQKECNKAINNEGRKYTWHLQLRGMVKKSIWHPGCVRGHSFVEGYVAIWQRCQQRSRHTSGSRRPTNRARTTPSAI